MLYDSCMLRQDSSEELNQNGDGMSCVTGVTGITGTSYFTQDRRINLTEEFEHVVGESKTCSNKNPSIAALKHLQYKMNAINHEPSKW